MENKDSLIIDELIKIGLTKYEAMLYITLLKSPEITAYEISKRSMIPQSKIYDVVKSVSNKGLVIINDSKPVKYSALPIDEFLDRYKRETDDTLSYLKKNITSIDKTERVDFMWHINGLDKILSKLKAMIKGAQKSIYMSVWAEDYNYLYKELLAASKKGIEIVAVLYGEPEKKVGQVYYHEMHGMEKDAEENGRWMSIVVDYKQCIFNIFTPSEATGVWTENKSFMLLAECFITHDIFIAEIYLKHKDELDREFGYNLQKIREKLSIG